MSPEVELSVVVPVYEEEQAAPEFLERAVPVLEDITPDYEIIFCLDPGGDRTDEVIREHIEKNARIRLLIMTRRWGQNAAMMAGLDQCRGEACVIIDVDLQDPPEVIKDLYAKWKEGHEVVYAQRRTRKGDPLLRRFVAYLGYRILDRISDVPIPRDVGDFRLVDRQVIEGLRNLKETHGFLRGLVPYVGYRQTCVRYDRDERAAGRSRYHSVGSFRHALDGVTAFSIRPLSLATVSGFIAVGLSFLAAVICLMRNTCGGGTKWVAVAVFFIGGVQLICLGIAGEYIGRIYEEVRGRPKYMIARKVNFADGE